MKILGSLGGILAGVVAAGGRPSAASLPAELFVCDADQLNFGGNLNGRLVLQSDTSGGVQFYQHESEQSLVIYWHNGSSAWFLNRSVGMDFAWYHLASKNLLTQTVAWKFVDGGSTPVTDGNWNKSHMRVGTTPGCYCAVIFDKNHANDEKFVVMREGNNANMRKIEQAKWSNKASFVQVQDRVESYSSFSENFS